MFAKYFASQRTLRYDGNECTKIGRRNQRAGGFPRLIFSVVVKGYIYSKEKFTSQNLFIQFREFEM